MIFLYCRVGYDLEMYFFMVMEWDKSQLFSGIVHFWINNL